ncbi:MAG TPA: PRC-barrel domain-containing protein [Candidatus Tectomicrobia bacterium]|nr:PRC-barrel domain-containing protein [Candidatus Tectomicrobia bacterium]
MLRRVDDLRGYTVGAVDGDVGSIEDVYFDDQSWTVRYVVVDTGTWLTGRKVLVSPHSVRGVDAAGRRLVTDLTVQKVKGSPSVETARPVSRQYELEYATYHGHPRYWLGPYRWGAALYPGAVLGGPAYPPTTPDDVPPATEEMLAREHESPIRTCEARRPSAGTASARPTASWATSRTSWSTSRAGRSAI